MVTVTTRTAGRPHPLARRLRVVAALAVLAIGLTVVAPPSGRAGPAAERYFDEIFTDVAVTHDVLYRQTTDYQGNPIDLRLDFYEPVGDPVAERPAIVFMHGGWFAFGSKDGMDVVAEIYARRGFVVFAIDYRLDPDNGWDTFSSIDQAMGDPVFIDSVLDAFHDARAAVKHIRDNAGSYRVDPDVIVGAGHSAGATLALLLAYLPINNNDPSSPDHEYHVAAAMPWSGAMMDWLIGPNEPPTHMAHGTADGTIPYSHGLSICNSIIANGVVCDLQTLEGVGHGLFPHREAIIADEVEFLWQHVLEPRGYSTQWPPPEPAPSLPPEPAPDPAPTEAAPTDPASGQGAEAAATPVARSPVATDRAVAAAPRFTG